MTEVAPPIAGTPAGLSWWQLHWTRPIEAEQVTALLRQWASDQRSPTLILEVRSLADQLTYVLGAAVPSARDLHRTIAQFIPGTSLSPLPARRQPTTAAIRVKATTRHRPLRSSDPFQVVRALLSALSHTKKDEQAVVQIMLGPRRVPLAIPVRSPSSIVMPWWEVAWQGNGGVVDGEKRSALREKVADHGFACSVRLGATASTPARQRALLLGLMAAVRVSEAAGIQLRAGRDQPRRLNAARKPWRWPLRLNVQELTGLIGWPLGDVDLPGLAALHPKQVAPTQLAQKGDRIVGAPVAAGVQGQIGHSINDAMRHSWVIGPTGTGKSTLLLNLIAQDLNANRAVVVIEPRDLVADVIARIPERRNRDVVLLDATDPSPVGINPLDSRGRSPELVADGLLATFQALYGDGLGPRSTDILHNCLRVLAAHPNTSLVMLPLLLTNDGFRRSLTAPVIKADPIAAGPFWSWYEHLTPDARGQVIAPLSNKLRPLLRPQLRAVLGQRMPRFNVRDVLLGKKILLVPLQPGVIGPDSAELLGALVVSELWLALRERVRVPEADRAPVMLYLDEVQTFLRLPTDLSDALATSRSLRASWTVAHQYIGQLSPGMKAAFEANARSRVAFQLNAADARAMASGQRVLAPEDFSALPAFHAYASLMHDNQLQPWASVATPPPPPACSDPEIIRALSRDHYGQPLEQIEADFASLLDEPATGSRRPRRSPTTATDVVTDQAKAAAEDDVPTSDQLGRRARRPS